MICYVLKNSEFNKIGSEERTLRKQAYIAFFDENKGKHRCFPTLKEYIA